MLNNMCNCYPENIDPDTGTIFFEFVQVKSKEMHTKYQQMAMDDEGLLEQLMDKMGVTSQEFMDKEKSLVLYGSETGNAHGLADVFKQELKRRGVEAKVISNRSTHIPNIARR